MVAGSNQLFLLPVSWIQSVFEPCVSSSRKSLMLTLSNDSKPGPPRLCQDFEAQRVEVNGEVDHTRLLVNYPPRRSVSLLVNSLKGMSSASV